VVGEGGGGDNRVKKRKMVENSDITPLYTIACDITVKYLNTPYK
jgi:hypothetical protein